ncbi:MAG: D-aminoacyl-tRNA deacylase [Zestosphaera sp.]
MFRPGFPQTADRVGLPVSGYGRDIEGRHTLGLQASAGVIGVVYNVDDPAGKGVADHLRRVFRCRETRRSGSIASWVIEEVDAVLVGFREDVIYFDFLDDVLPEANSYVVLSLHRASSGIKSLTVHHTGNPTAAAEAGGRPRELSIANPSLTYSILSNLSRLASEGLPGFEVVYEVTHHGPTNLEKPLTFVEIGSSESEWRLKRAHAVVGDAVADALINVKLPPNCTPTVGFGGPHYAEGFTKRALSLGECYGHIISRYAIKELSTSEGELREVSRLAVLRSNPPAVKAVIAKMGAIPRSSILDVLKSLGIQHEITG